MLGYISLLINLHIRTLQEDVLTGKPLDPTLKELKYNPKADELYAPEVSNY